tara:strand:- start:304 stop:765 length:462 start_codon:yes stop_codon:yes gene_type:complete
VIRKLYIDTSVVGGYYDDEFKEDTRALWSLWESGEYRFCTSEILFQEVTKAPKRVRELAYKTFKEEAQIYHLTEESFELSQKYLEHQVVSSKYADDARHVAIAAVNGIELVVSWNFTHMVNVTRNDKFNAVNLLQGSSNVRIISPKMLLNYED